MQSTATATVVGCGGCGVRATTKDRRWVTVRDAPAGNVAVVVRWPYQHVLPGMQADAAEAAERLTGPRPTTSNRSSTAKPAPAPKRRTTAKKPTKNTPRERRGNNRRKAA